MIKYEAIYLPVCDNIKDPSKKGFDSENDAWDYIIKHFCKGCSEFENPIESYCAAEWMVDEYIDQ